MEIHAIAIHQKITSLMRDNCPQNAFRIDNEGYEYIDPLYQDLYDDLYSVILSKILWI